MRASNTSHYQTKQRPLPSDQSFIDSSSDSDDSHPIAQVANLSESRFKQLLTDIEEAGGRKFFRLGKVCKEKPEIYGLPSSGQQQQFRNKLRTVRRYTEADYQLVLSLNNVRSCRIAARPLLVSPERTKNPSETPTETTTKNPSETTTKTAIMSTPSSTRSRTRRTSPPSRSRRFRDSSAENSGDEDNYDDSAGPAKLLSQVTIHVDLEHPCNNREVVVYSLVRVEHGQSLYDCYDIYLQTDVRDF